MKVLSIKEVTAMTGASRSTIWRWEQSGLFPRRIQIGPHKVGWIEGEVTSWLKSRPRGCLTAEYRTRFERANV